MRDKYRAGACFERRIQKGLEKDGWYCVRSAGSHKVTDLIALRRGELMLIQAKTSGHFSKGEREVLYVLAEENCCTAKLCWRGDKHENFKLHWKEVEYET